MPPKVMSLNTDAGRLVVAQRSTQSHRRLRIPSLASTVLQADQPMALMKQRSRQLFKAQLWPATEMIRSRVATLAINLVSSKKSRYFLSFMRTVFRDTVPTFPPKVQRFASLTHLTRTRSRPMTLAMDLCQGLKNASSISQLISWNLNINRAPYHLHQAQGKIAQSTSSTTIAGPPAKRKATT